MRPMPRLHSRRPQALLGGDKGLRSPRRGHVPRPNPADDVTAGISMATVRTRSTAPSLAGVTVCLHAEDADPVPDHVLDERGHQDRGA